MRSLARDIRDRLYSTLLRSGLGPPKNTLTILTYHRILPRNSPEWQITEPGMRVDPHTFERHLVWAKKHFVPIHLHDWVANKDQLAGNGKRYLAITFDDGWQDNFAHAFALLEKYKFPATIFLVADAVDQVLEFWTERLASIYFDDEGRTLLGEDTSLWRRSLNIDAQFFARPATTERFAKLVDMTKSIPDAEINAELQRLLECGSKEGEFRRKPNSRHFMNWSEVLEIGNSNFVQFGSHTLSHTRLNTTCDSERIHHEVVGSQRMLRERLGESFKDVFCYPNGDMCDAAERTVREHYRAACTVDAGVNPDSSDTFRLQRISMHEDISASLAGFNSVIFRNS